MRAALQHIEPISRPAVALVIDATYQLNLVHHHITARIRFYPHGHMSAITELEAALRGTAPQVDADTDGEDVEALPAARPADRDVRPLSQAPARGRRAAGDATARAAATPASPRDA